MRRHRRESFHPAARARTPPEVLCLAMRESGGGASAAHGSWAALLAIVVAVVGCGMDPAPGAGTSAAVPVDGSFARGPADAWVTVVEFADFQCPFCRAEAPVLEQVRQARPDDVRLVLKHLPLAVHPAARPAAIAAECAGEQGRFWPMHDLLFARAALGEADLVACAAQLELDLAAWQACRAGGAAARRVDEDVALALQLGVRGTPTLFVNGERVEGALSPDALSAIVERALDAARASGVPRASYYDQVVLGR